MVGKFQITKFISDVKQESDFNPRVVEDSTSDIFLAFNQLAETVYRYFQNKYQQADNLQREEYEKMQYEAIIGNPKYIKMLKDEISKYLDSADLKHTSYPEHIYNSLVDGIFHKNWGFDCFAPWFSRYSYSQSAKISGRRIFFEDKDGRRKLLPFQFEKAEDVERIIRHLTMKDNYAKLNDDNTSIEIDMYDGTRVTIIIPPTSLVYTIIFRRFVIPRLTLEDYQKIEPNPFPSEMIPILRGLAPATICFTGRVKSGKSTLLKILFGERDPYEVTTVLAKKFELFLSEAYPDRDITELQSKDGFKVHELIPIVLRSDLEFGILEEVRSDEAEAAMMMAERGNKVYLTYHSSKVNNIPFQIADLIIENKPNKNYISEIIRAAQNINIAIVNKELKDRSKRVINISEIRFDDKNMVVSSHPICLWDEETDTWRYKFDLSEELIKELRSSNKENTNLMIQYLKKLEQRYPFEKDMVEQTLINFGG